ncbi:hypothetical protein [Sphingomonas sp. R-74633]|uniref:hypothetical protein n=1 Tax=Sphingomonas sp. R-74633 TaxID=2751188 RepID=UPI0015D448BD|nr:hypothetical protein [Sphingomonas sp. R-74633]
MIKITLFSSTEAAEKAEYAMYLIKKLHPAIVSDILLRHLWSKEPRIKMHRSRGMKWLDPRAS